MTATDDGLRKNKNLQQRYKQETFATNQVNYYQVSLRTEYKKKILKKPNLSEIKLGRGSAV